MAAVGSTSASQARTATLPFTPPSSPLSDYERVLSETPHMDFVGNPRSWTNIICRLHPFAPERTAVFSPIDYHFGDRRGKDVRARIDERIQREHGHLEGFDKRWFPDAKRESIYGIMDRMSQHYRSPALFEEWVVGLAVREMLGSTAYCGMGFAHQYQYCQTGGRLDCPPIDWWLFLYPEGVDWAALDKELIFAVIAPLAPDRSFVQWRPGQCSAFTCWHRLSGGRCTDSAIGWRGVAHMGRVAACQHLNEIAVQHLSRLAT